MKYRGLICGGQIHHKKTETQFDTNKFSGAQFAAKGPNLPGPNLLGPNLPRTRTDRAFLGVGLERAYARHRRMWTSPVSQKHHWVGRL